jgi:hypothetical protein
MRATFTPKTLMLAALLALAPAGAAFAAQDCSGDAHAAYHRALGGDDPGYLCVQSATWQTGAAGPSGPIIASADVACGRDPFDGTWRAFNTGGPAQLCGLMVTSQSGAQGPTGPLMADERSDPFYRYNHDFPGD